MNTLPAIHHPAYGTGEPVSFDEATGLVTARFPNPPGMSVRPESLLPTAQMKLVNGQFVPLYMLEEK